MLAHDRPGCGGSPGDFLSQTLDDRADESLAALAVLRDRVSGPVGFLGFSQGGWVGLVAAARPGSRVDFLASVSGPGVGPRAQDRHRIEVDLRAAGLPRLTGLAVFPGADHGLFVADPAPGVDRTSQLAPGFLPMLRGFLHSVGQPFPVAAG